MPDILRNGPIVMDLTAGKVWLDNKRIRVSKTEWRPLHLFLQHVGALLTYERIIASVWFPGKLDGQRQAKVYVKSLRNKLGDADRSLMSMKSALVIEWNRCSQRIAVLAVANNLGGSNRSGKPAPPSFTAQARE